MRRAQTPESYADGLTSDGGCGLKIQPNVQRTADHRTSRAQAAETRRRDRVQHLQP